MADGLGPIIKICGLRDVASAQVAIEAGATAIGFVMAPSRREVSPDEVRSVLEKLSSSRPAAVGVVVNKAAESVQTLRSITGVDIVQLAGDESPRVLAGIDGETWKALRFGPGTDLAAAQREVELWLDNASPVSAIVLDAAVAGIYGGSGHVADWELAAALAADYPIILAGGLTPDNVAPAIETVRPRGVDVSSGVERDGVKHPGRIRAFVTAAADAFKATRLDWAGHRR